MKIPIYTEEQVEAVFDVNAALKLAEETFGLMASGQAKMPSKIYLDLPGGADFRAMPAWVGGSTDQAGACGIKWVSVFPDNRALGKPTVTATILLNSTRTGELLAVLGGTAITAIRTAATAALAARHLARRDSAVIALVGAGLQARYQLRALLPIFGVKEVRVWGALGGEAAAFCRRERKTFDRLVTARDIESCVRGADIVVTCTPSRKPLVRARWIEPGTHINAIGADAPGKQELDPHILGNAKVVVDEEHQAVHSGEINVPISRGAYDPRDLHASLADIVSGRRVGRSGPREVTVFDSTGLAVLDIHFARYAYERLSRR
ncbi:MAG: Alanine dehydrogenase [Candidatus Omnitrophica bacterium]|nr:Alanine dehydrogenase [Candidatus Omnitrophota bacterium]